MTLDQLRAYYTAAPNFVARQKKTASQLRYAWPPKQVSFVFGCQRSGTKMIMRILDNSPAIHIFHENHRSAFVDFQIRSDAVVRTLSVAHPAPCQVFKPICNSQEADRILDAFPDAAGLWVYRAANDVANSAAVKWGEHQRDLVTAVYTGDFATWGWRTALLPEGTVAALRGVWRPDLTPSEGALLFWYMRNAFYFSLSLDQHPRMRLVRYEDVVREPLSYFPPVFAHVGAPFDPSFVARVRGDSVGRAEPPPASPEIRALVDDLQARLDEAAPKPKRVPAPIGSVPQRVLMLINTLGVGGAEKHVMTLANWMVQEGAKVTVMASPGALSSKLEPSVRYVPTDLVRIRAGLGRAAAAVRAVIAEDVPDVILCNSLAVTLVARLASPWGRVVNIAHGWPPAEYGTVAPLMRAADRVIAVSDDVRTRLVAGGLAPSRCVVVENGVDLAPFSGVRDGGLVAGGLRAELGIGADQVLVVSAGRLTAQKAQHHLVSLAAKLRDRPYRWVIVGTGDREEALRAQIASLGVGDRVRLLGLRGDVPAIFAAADLYVSTSDWEGMPLTLIEAMAAGLPIVATRTEGSSQLLTPECAITVPIGDEDALATAILSLSAEDRVRLGAAGRARAVASYGHARMGWEICAALP